MFSRVTCRSPASLKKNRNVAVFLIWIPICYSSMSVRAYRAHRAWERPLYHAVAEHLASFLANRQVHGRPVSSLPKRGRFADSVMLFAPIRLKSLSKALSSRLRRVRRPRPTFAARAAGVA
jgi:hypothetical protein